MAYLRLVQCKSIYIGAHTLSPNSINDFDALGDKRPVNNPAKYFRKHGRDFFVCCADFEKEGLVLVRPKEGIRIKEATFFREAIRTHAAEVLVIPFAQLADVAAEVSGDVFHITTIFLYHSARCGSTLLVRALEASGLVHGVSEPDIHVTFLQYLQSQPGLQGAHLKMLTDVMGYSNTLFNFTLFQQDPTRVAVCHKTRAEVIHVAELLQKAVPDAKAVFLYREVIGSTESVLRIFMGSYWKYWLFSALRLDTLLAKRIPDSLMSLLGVAGDRRLLSAPVPHGILWFRTCCWAKRMQTAVELTENEKSVFNVVLRYEELCRYREDMVLKILEDIGIVFEDGGVKEKIKAVFEVNSQAGHKAAGRFGTASTSWVGDWEKGVISTILTHANMDFNRPDFLVKGTITEI